MEFSLEKANQNSAALISNLANTIWNECYSEVVPQKITSFLLENFQTPEAIAHQIEKENYLYYLIKYQGKIVGYTAIVPETKYLYLSKIYILKEYRKLGLFSKTLQNHIEFAKKHNLSELRLNVNRHNKNALAAYQKAGFEILEEVDKDFGGGIVLEDYVMRKVI